MESLNYIVDDDNNCIDLETGEIIDIQDLIKAKQGKAIDDFNNVKQELMLLGNKEDFRIVKYKGIEHPCVVVKNKYTFGKVFRVDVREIMKDNKLSIYARGFIATYEPYISFPTNSIIVDSKHPSQEVYEEMLGVKKSKIYSIFKELEYYDVIKRIKVNGQLIIYFNPFLYSSGGIIHKDTYELFKFSVYNPSNSINK